MCVFVCVCYSCAVSVIEIIEKLNIFVKFDILLNELFTNILLILTKHHHNHISEKNKNKNKNIGEKKKRSKQIDNILIIKYCNKYIYVYIIKTNYDIKKHKDLGENTI